MQDNYEKNMESSSKNSRCKIVFLVWDKEGIRASGISKHIGASLHFLYTSRIKHPVLFFKSLQILRKERPRIIICQSPPITCAFIAMIYQHFFAWASKPKILIDVHGIISRPWFENLGKLIMKLVMKHASGILVINEEWQNYFIENYQVKPIVLEDPIPDFTGVLSSAKKHEGYKIDKRAEFNVAVISSFAVDEPLQVVFDAGSQLRDVYFYITGDEKKVNKDVLIKKPDNVILTGFLDYITYVDLLQKVDVIMDLTTEDKSLVAGAYEAVALEQPLITSDWSSLRRYFNKGTVYINNSADDVIRAIMDVRTRKEDLSNEMHQLKLERTKEWEEKISDIYYLFQ